MQGVEERLAASRKAFGYTALAKASWLVIFTVFSTWMSPGAADPSGTRPDKEEQKAEDDENED